MAHGEADFSLERSVRAGVEEPPERDRVRLEELAAPNVARRARALAALFASPEDHDSWMACVLVSAAYLATLRWKRERGADGRSDQIDLGQLTERIARKLTRTITDKPFRYQGAGALLSFLTESAYRTIAQKDRDAAERDLATMLEEGRQAVRHPCGSALSQLDNHAPIGGWLKAVPGWTSLSRGEQRAALRLLDESVFAPEPPFMPQVPSLDGIAGKVEAFGLSMATVHAIAVAAVNAEQHDKSYMPPAWVRDLAGKRQDVSRGQFEAIFTRLRHYYKVLQSEATLPGRVAAELSVDPDLVRAVLGAARERFLALVPGGVDNRDDSWMAAFDGESHDVREETNDSGSYVLAEQRRLANLVRTLENKADRLDREQAGEGANPPFYRRPVSQWLRFVAYLLERREPVVNPDTRSDNALWLRDQFFAWAVQDAAQHPPAWAPRSKRSPDVKECWDAATSYCQLDHDLMDALAAFRDANVELWAAQGGGQVIRQGVRDD